MCCIFCPISLGNPSEKDMFSKFIVLFLFCMFNFVLPFLYSGFTNDELLVF